jgi:hypothetical protein
MAFDEYIKTLAPSFNPELVHTLEQLPTAILEACPPKRGKTAFTAHMPCGTVVNCNLSAFYYRLVKLPAGAPMPKQVAFSFKRESPMEAWEKMWRTLTNVD